MERPHGISDFAFPTQWDRESGPDLVERAGQYRVVPPTSFSQPLVPVVVVRRAPICIGRQWPPRFLS
jgi:hypothetical protein